MDLRHYALNLSELGLQGPDLDLFEMEIEAEWDERASKCLDWWREAPDRLEEGVLADLGELLWLEGFFREREEYERCAVLVAQQARFKSHFPQIFLL